MTVARPEARAVPTTLVEALERAARVPAAGVRLLDRREHATWLPWSEIAAGALGVAGRLAASGVSAGERVALVHSTGRELLEALFGTLLAGAVPACLPPPPRFGRLNGYGARTRAMIESVGARLVLAEERRAHRLAGVVAAPLGVKALGELAAGEPSPPAVGPDALALIQFSSGTTVAPKPVALSHASVLAQARLLNSLWPDSAGAVQRGLSWLPLYHDMGLIGCLFVALERPGELTLIPPEVFAARPATWLRAISRFGATVSPATNFAYGYCVDQVADRELEGVDLSSWRIALNGAEPVSADVMRRFADRFAPWGFDAGALTPVYGLAEAALAVTFSEVGRPFVSRRFAREALGLGDRVREESGGRELVSVGRPVAGFELSIRAEDGAEVESGVIGRIWARGPSLMQGYLGQPEATREALRDGWLDTGDLGFVHRGELFICGRLKDLIIVRGRNHSPVDIERAVEALPGVRRGGVVAVGYRPESADDELLVLFVERARKAAPADLEALPGACRRAVLADTGLEVDRLIVLAPDSLPRTSSGKVRRAEALRRWERRELGS